MDQLIFLLIVGFIALAKWLIKQKDSAAGEEFLEPKLPPVQREQQPQQRREPPPFQPATGLDPEQERMRKFLEALGVPAGSVPPMPRQKQRPFTPPPMQQPQTVTRRVTAQTVMRRAAPTPPPMPVTAEEGPQIKLAPVGAGKEAEPIFETVTSRISAATELPSLPENLINGLDAQTGDPTATGGVKQAPPVRSTFDWLHSQPELRRAILLREILGQPRALQPYAGGPL